MNGQTFKTVKRPWVVHILCFICQRYSGHAYLHFVIALSLFIQRFRRTFAMLVEEAVSVSFVFTSFERPRVWTHSDKGLKLDALVFESFLR